ncbi:hypothetical protein M2192_008271 [Bradyrhizobium elkanii USDA 61]|nr:hypothetical protein [Bradyrhizobium elkanii]MCS4011311.1 hypothetical protein [Bradyrhizobium elkanii USDA 61]MCS3477288.1 hypothetical protein [Bradyrhizobium elkanii]MCS3562391.1 hypothetical protein [Bradyrhizobium elkanii]MCS3584022.1 hypothetical protein [Bradyrhizobium elkanii]
MTNEQTHKSTSVQKTRSGCENSGLKSQPATYPSSH